MKVALGYRPYSGPWGGGNRFAAALADGLSAGGHDVRFDLRDRDIDIVVLTDPRWRNPTASFGAGKILRYLLLGNPNALVVHRVNECDERKGTKHMNALLARANYCADHTVFVGAWLRDLPIWREHPPREWSVIRNGADTALFHSHGFVSWEGKGPLRLATHHWGANERKGFDVYRELDRMLGDPGWRQRIAFTYVGNLPDGFRFANARHVPPLDGTALADELRRHHAYVTASINEPGGNHQNEAALCGLPLLYRRSGCLPEYCEGFGIPFDGPADMPAVIEGLISDYPRLVAHMSAYPHTAARMCGDWLDLFKGLLARRSAILEARRIFRNPLLFTLNQLPV